MIFAGLHTVFTVTARRHHVPSILLVACLLAVLRTSRLVEDGRRRLVDLLPPQVLSNRPLGRLEKDKTLMSRVRRSLAVIEPLHLQARLEPRRLNLRSQAVREIFHSSAFFLLLRLSTLVDQALSDT